MEAEPVPYLQAKEIRTAAELTKQEYSPEGLQEEAVFAQYIQEEETASYEQEEAWFRWRYEVESVDVKEMERGTAGFYIDQRRGRCICE